MQTTALRRLLTVLFLLTCPATADILFRTPWEDLYQAVLKLIGIDLNQLSEFVGHA